MPEYIEREALFKRLKEETHDYDAAGKYKEGIIKGLNIAKSIVNDKARTPTADVVEVKHGEWKYYNKDDIAVCKNCSYEHYLGTYHQYATNHCPYCGAKMDLKEGAEE